jgi:hypothetical protein
MQQPHQPPIQYFIAITIRHYPALTIPPIAIQPSSLE